jgi:peroxiredoxin
MLHTITFFLILFFIGNSNEELEIGKKLPEFKKEMKDISEKSFKLDDIKKENGLLLVFSCNTCPWVIKWQDRYPEIATHAKNQKIGFALINSNEGYRSDEDSFEAMQKHAKKYDYDYKYLVDKDHLLADLLGANKTPHVFLFNSKGILVYRGAIDDNASDKKKVKNKYLLNAMTELSENMDISLKTTKSLGCSIKRLSN